METEVPEDAIFGLKELMIGGDKKLNPAKEMFPFGEAMLTAPDEPLPTIAVIVF